MKQLTFLGQEGAAARRKRRAEEARAKMGAAIDRVEENADEAWMEAAMMAVKHVCTQRKRWQDQDGLTFTTDDVWEAIDHLARGFDPPLDPPHEPRAMGAVMLKASRAGLIQKTNLTKDSVRPECNCRPVRVWRVL